MKSSREASTRTTTQASKEHKCLQSVCEEAHHLEYSNSKKVHSSCLVILLGKIRLEAVRETLLIWTLNSYSFTLARFSSGCRIEVKHQVMRCIFSKEGRVFTRSNRPGFVSNHRLAKNNKCELII